MTTAREICMGTVNLQSSSCLNCIGSLFSSIFAGAYFTNSLDLFSAISENIELHRNVLVKYVIEIFDVFGLK